MNWIGWRISWLFVLLPLTAYGQIGALFGLGPKSSSLGGVSLLQGVSSAHQVYGAPAGLGYLRTVEASVSFQYFDPKLPSFGTLVLNSNGTRGEFNGSGVLPGGAQMLGLAFPLGRERPLVLAGAIFLPMGTLIRVSGNPVNYPFYPLYSDIARNFFFVLGAGMEVGRGWSLGLNLRSTTKSTAAYTLRADNTVNYSANAVEAKSESRISVSLLHDHSRFGSPWTAGAMYRARSGLETRLSADVTAFVPVQGELNGLPAFSPAEWVAMGTAAFGPRWKVSAELSRVLWSDYNSPFGSGNINSYVIGPRRQEAGFKDIWVPKIGFERKSPQNHPWMKFLAWRMGYAFHPSPVPDQTSDSNYADSNRHSITGGIGMETANFWGSSLPIDVDLFLQYHHLETRQVSKTLGNNVGAPGYRLGGKILLYGLGLTLRY
jgi:hypothetical protein